MSPACHPARDVMLGHGPGDLPSGVDLPTGCASGPPRSARWQWRGRPRRYGDGLSCRQQPIEEVVRPIRRRSSRPTGWARTRRSARGSSARAAGAVVLIATLDWTSLRAGLGSPIIPQLDARAMARFAEVLTRPQWLWSFARTRGPDLTLPDMARPGEPAPTSSAPTESGCSPSRPPGKTSGGCAISGTARSC